MTLICSLFFDNFFFVDFFFNWRDITYFPHTLHGYSSGVVFVVCKWWSWWCAVDTNDGGCFWFVVVIILCWNWVVDRDVNSLIKLFVVWVKVNLRLSSNAVLAVKVNWGWFTAIEAEVCTKLVFGVGERRTVPLPWIRICPFNAALELNFYKHNQIAEGKFEMCFQYLPQNMQHIHRWKFLE